MKKEQPREEDDDAEEQRCSNQLEDSTEASVEDDFLLQVVQARILESTFDAREAEAVTSDEHGKAREEHEEAGLKAASEESASIATSYSATSSRIRAKDTIREDQKRLLKPQEKESKEAPAAGDNRGVEDQSSVGLAPAFHRSNHVVVLDESQPGAYARAPPSGQAAPPTNGAMVVVRTTNAPPGRSNRTVQEEGSNSGLMVANLVMDSSQPSLPTAQAMDGNNTDTAQSTERRKQIEQRYKSTFWGLAIGLVLVAAGIVLAVFLASRQQSNSAGADTLLTTDIPTQTPIDPEDILLSLLSQETIQALRDPEPTNGLWPIQTLLLTLLGATSSGLPSWPSSMPRQGLLNGMTPPIGKATRFMSVIGFMQSFVVTVIYSCTCPPSLACWTQSPVAMVTMSRKKPTQTPTPMTTTMGATKACCWEIMDCRERFHKRCICS